MPSLINHGEAIAFLRSIDDPVVEAVIQHAHSLIFTELSDNFTTDLDALLLYKILAALFRDRQGLVNFLSTEIPEIQTRTKSSEEHLALGTSGS